MKRNILILFIVLLLVSSVSGEIILFRQGEPVRISHPIRIDGAPSSSIVANITVKQPVSNIITAVSNMTYNSNILEHEISLNSGNSSKIGVYEYCISGTNGTVSDTECFEYEVTITGVKPSTSQGIIYFFLGSLSIIFFGLTLFGAIKIKWKNPRNDRGVILGINDLKYLKLFLWFVSYLILIFIFFSFRHVSFIANWDVAGNFFNGTFWFLIVFLLPIFILTVTSAFVSFFADKKILRLIERGFKVR